MAMSSRGSTLDLDTSEVIAELHFSTGGDTMYVHVKSAPPHLVNRQTTKTGAAAFGVMGLRAMVRALSEDACSLGTLRSISTATQRQSCAYKESASSNTQPV